MTAGIRVSIHRIRNVLQAEQDEYVAFIALSLCKGLEGISISKVLIMDKPCASTRLSRC